MRHLLRAGCVGLLLLLPISAGPVGSQNRPGAAGGMRVALVNLVIVFKSYARVAEFTVENNALLKPFQEKAKELKEQIDAHAQALKHLDLPEETRAEHEKNQRKRQRELEDLNAELKRLFTRKTEEQMVTIYKEVLAAVQRHARAHDLDLVLQYNDVADDLPDFWSAANVKRKIEAGATIPLVLGSEQDITDDIVAALNEAYRKEKGGEQEER